MRTVARGFVNLEFVLFIGLTTVGVLLAYPTIRHLLRHEPVTTGGWVAFGFGLYLVVAGAGSFLVNLVKAFRDARKR